MKKVTKTSRMKEEAGIDFNALMGGISSDEMREFLETFPLYVKRKAVLPDNCPPNITPDVIYLVCPTCKVERPYRGQTEVVIPILCIGQREVGFIAPRLNGCYEIYYICTGCDTQPVQFFVEFNYDQGWLRKIGQLPPWSIDISKELEKDLGADASLYKKALTLMSQSYGMGACVYLRRMIENQINPLLEILYEIRKSEGADPEELKAITEAQKSKNFIEKVAEASALIPDSLVVDGQNPLKLIYDELSINIHARDDAESMKVALKIKPSFEYLIIELNRRRDSKKKFIDSIKSLRK